MRRSYTSAHQAEDVVVLNEDKAKPERKLASSAASSLPSSAPVECNVLIVDDDRTTARALAALLAEAGFVTTVLHSGREAIRHATKERVSAAIVDVHLPDLNGLVLSMSLRERFGPAVPIFVVSGDTSMETINSLPHVGATHFFAKPMSPTYVIQRLKDCLK